MVILMVLVMGFFFFYFLSIIRIIATKVWAHSVTGSGRYFLRRPSTFPLSRKAISQAALFYQGTLFTFQYGHRASLAVIYYVSTTSMFYGE